MSYAYQVTTSNFNNINGRKFRSGTHSRGSNIGETFSGFINNKEYVNPDRYNHDLRKARQRYFSPLRLSNKHNLTHHRKHHSPKRLSHPNSRRHSRRHRRNRSRRRRRNRSRKRSRSRNRKRSRRRRSKYYN